VGSRVLIRFGSAAVLGAAMLIALALAAPAMALKTKRATFKVEIDGSVFTDWTLDSTTQDLCSGGQTHQTGSGRQDFSLTTKKPVKVIAAWIKGGGADDVFFGRAPAGGGIPVNVAAIREGTVQSETIGGNGQPCGDGGEGSAPPPPPDCGSRSFNSEVQMEHMSPDQFFGDPVPLVDVLVLEGPRSQNGDSMDDQWTNCPGGGPGEFEQTTNGGLPKKKIFGNEKEFTVKAKDVSTSGSSGFTQRTESKWRTVFKRVD
jgi:hypothetical protein